MAAMPIMPLLKISRQILCVAVFLPFLHLPGALRAEDPVRPSYLDGMVRDYFQKWEDSLQGGHANETVFQLTEIDTIFNSATYKTIKIQLQQERKKERPNLRIEIKQHGKTQPRNLLITRGVIYESENNQINICDFNPKPEPLILYSPARYQDVVSDFLRDVLYDNFTQFYYPKSILNEYDATRCEDNGKTVVFYLRRKLPTRSWAAEIRRIVFQKSGGYPIQLETGGTDQVFYNLLKMDPRPNFDPILFDPPTRQELLAKSSKYNNLLPAYLKHPLHPGPQSCNELR